MLNYHHLTKEKLFKLIADKDPGVVEYIYDKYSPALYGIIFENTKLRKEAGAILMDTFVTFFNEKSKQSSLRDSIFVELYIIAFISLKKRNVVYMTNSDTEIQYPKLSSGYNHG